MVFKMNNPFGDDLVDLENSSDIKGEDENKSNELENLTIDSLVKSFTKSSIETINERESSLIQEATKELASDVIADVFRANKKKERNEKINAKRREARRIKRANRIANAMLTIRPKYAELTNEIQSLVVKLTKDENEANTLNVTIMKGEAIWLENSQPNNYRTFEEAVEENYVFYLEYTIGKLISLLKGKEK